MRIYLAGGAVRNLLLGEPVSETDFVYVGNEGEFRALFPRAQEVGRDFRIFIVDGKEYAPARGEDIAADLLRRDLTVNAMAIELRGPRPGRLHAHPRALEDIRNRILRPCADDVMHDDPLRVLRAARFAARYPEFTPHPDLLQAMRDAAARQLLDRPAAERVGLELLKALATSRPGRFVQLLAETGCLTPWFAEFERADRIPAGPAPFHTDSVLGHTIAVMNRLAGQPLHVYLGLCHDLGKCATDPEQWPRHYGHEALGVARAQSLAARLRLPVRYVRAGEIASRWHMLAGRYDELRPGTRVDLLLHLDARKLVEGMCALVLADRNRDISEAVQRDLAALHAVELPPEARGLGLESGMRLRTLRCQALANVAARQM